MQLDVTQHVPPRNAGGIKNRIKKLYILLNKEKWTSKSPLSNTIPLHIKWLVNPHDFLNNCDMKCPEHITQEYV